MATGDANPTSAPRARGAGDMSMTGAMRPSCWKCAYDLTGLEVTGVCPECGTPVWPGPAAAPTSAAAQLHPEALAWGVASLVLLCTCLGPSAGLVAIPAVVKGWSAMKLVRAGRYPSGAALEAKIGMALGCVTIGLGCAMLTPAAVMFFLSET